MLIGAVGAYFIKNAFRSITLSFLLAVTLLLSACSSVSYYTQSVLGHSRLMLARQPIAEAISKADPELAEQLQLALELREFAVSELGLPDNKSYQSYVPLKRDYPVWVVVAAEPFSLNAKQWCYLVIGCASYRGYFTLSAAERYAKSLQAKGFETYIGGAAAYSTLGWFSDPLLPSMLGNNAGDLAEILFHELAHQVLYINNDSDFNEAFASVVGERGALKWLQQHRPGEVEHYSAQLSALNDFNGLIKNIKERLNDVYTSDRSDAEKALARAGLFETLKEDYELMKAQKWNGKPWFDGWFTTPINNARLAAFSTYRDRVPELNEIFDQYNGDFRIFYTHF